MAIHPSQILHWSGGNVVKLLGTASRRTAPIARRGEEIIETFTRATPPASYVDAIGEVKLAEVDALRVNMLDLDVAGVFDVPAIGLEDTRQNVCLQSEDLGTTWADVATPVLTLNDAVAPDGKTTADKVEDNDAGSSEGRDQTVTVTDDSTTWVYSYYVKKAPAGAPVVVLRAQLTGGTPKDAALFIDPITGTSIANSDVVNSDVLDAGDHWRVWLSVANNGTGNTSLVLAVYPAGRLTGDIASATFDVTAVGSNHFWGMDAENAASPSSYIATVASAITRAVDSLSFPFYAAPQALTFYVRFIELGNILRTGGARIVHIGKSDNSGPHVFIGMPSSLVAYQILHKNVTSVTKTLAAKPSIGDLVELHGQFGPTGTVILSQSINSATAITTTESAALALAGAWSDTRIWLNSVGSIVPGFNNFIDSLVVAGIHSLADCRTATQQ